MYLSACLWFQDLPDWVVNSIAWIHFIGPAHGWVHKNYKTISRKYFAHQKSFITIGMAFFIIHQTSMTSNLHVLCNFVISQNEKSLCNHLLQLLFTMDVFNMNFLFMYH